MWRTPNFDSEGLPVLKLLILDGCIPAALSDDVVQHLKLAVSQLVVQLCSVGAGDDDLGEGLTERVGEGRIAEGIVTDLNTPGIGFSGDTIHLREVLELSGSKLVFESNHFKFSFLFCF